MDLVALGLKIKRLREEKNLSQDKLAEVSGVARNSVNQLEQGRGNPTLGTLQALGNVLGEQLVFLEQTTVRGVTPVEVSLLAQENDLLRSQNRTILETNGLVAKFLELPQEIQAFLLAVADKDPKAWQRIQAKEPQD